MTAAMLLHQLYGFTLASDFAFANRLALAQSDMPDLTFLCSADAPIRSEWDEDEPVFASPVRTTQGVPVVAVYRRGECDIIRYAHLFDYYLWPDRIHCHLRQSAYRHLVEIRFLGGVMCYWLERKGIPAVHAAANIVDGRAVAFMSSNSGGKTSLAVTMMQAGYPLLTDDVLPVERRGDSYLGRPGYPQIRMWPDEADHFLGYHQSLDIVHPDYSKRRVPLDVLGDFWARPQPLAVIYLPERRDPADFGAAVDIEPVPRAEALFMLARESFAGRILKALGNQAQRLGFFAGMLERVAVRRLRYPSGFEFAPTVRQALLDDSADIRGQLAGEG